MLTDERLDEIRLWLAELDTKFPLMLTVAEMLRYLLAGYDEVVEENEALVDVADSLTESLYQEGKKLEGAEAELRGVRELYATENAALGERLRAAENAATDLQTALGKEHQAWSDALAECDREIEKRIAAEQDAELLDMELRYRLAEVRRWLSLFRGWKQRAEEMEKERDQLRAEGKCEHDCLYCESTQNMYRLRAEVERLRSLIPHVCDTCEQHHGHFCALTGKYMLDDETCEQWEERHD